MEAPFEGIAGSKWEDLDGDGVWDAGEDGLSDWTIQLYVDDGNGTLGVEDALADEAVTDSQGDYAFQGLTTNTYFVQEVLQSGYAQTHPGAPGYHTINYSDGDEVLDVDFGNQPILGISGVKWHDLNGDGVMDAGEPGLEGWTITAWRDANGDGLIGGDESSFTTTTNVDGEYAFPTLAPGFYRVAETLEPGWVQTGPLAGVWQGELTTDGSIEDVNFGNMQLADASGVVWNDVNGDGVIDGGESLLEGWTVFADTDSDGELDAGEISAETAADGTYTLSDLAPGPYNLTVVIPPAWEATVPATGMISVNLVSGDALADQDLGVRQPALPDLASGSTDFSDYAPTTVNPGDAWQVDWRVVNNGTVASGDFQTAFYISADAAITTDDLLIGTVDAASIDAGGFADLTLNVASFPDVPAGEYFVGVIVDSAGAVAESDELNNTGVDDAAPLSVPGIRGTLWYDTNADGVMDPGEEPVAGQTIFIDADQDGIVDPGEVTATTDADGLYSFTGLPDGTYNIDVALPTGWSQSFPASPNYSISYTAGTVIAGRDFGVSGAADLLDEGDAFSGFDPQTVVSPGATWDVWWDIRNAGTGDAGSFVVRVYASVDNDISTTEDNILLDSETVAGLAAGQYLDLNLSLLGFPEIPAGDYYVGIVIDPLNSVLETDETNNTGVNLEYTLNVINRPDLQGAVPEDSGFDPPAVLPGDQWHAWFDVTNTGGEAADRFRVDYYASTNNSITTLDYHLGYDWVEGLGMDEVAQSAVSLMNFPDLPAGEYYVGIIIDRANVILEGDELNNKAVSSTYPLIVPGLSGTKWEDMDGDAVRDAADLGLSGWTIRLYTDDNDNGVLDPAEEATFQETTTDDDGRYEFKDLATGRYFVQEVQQAGWGQSYPADMHTVEYTVDTFVGQLDFGNAELVTISGVKWHDLDGDGVLDDGEPTLEGWTIFLDENDNGVLDVGETSTETDAGGEYSFTDLMPGQYVAAEVDEFGWMQSWPTGDGVYRLTVTSGSDEIDVNFGNYEPAEARGLKWHDVNSDGTRQIGEPGLDDWIIYGDVNDNGVLDLDEPSTVTDADGNYALTNLPPGDYTIREVLQDGWEQSFPVGGHAVTIVSGDVLADLDFGNFQPGEISGVKWHDLDADGVYKDAEDGLEGWTIFLDEDDNGLLDWTDGDGDGVWDAGEGEQWTLTDADGAYSFTGLTYGTYHVRELLQPDWEQSAPATGEYVVTVASGSVVTGRNFGNYMPAVIEGVKWHDINGDGGYDVGTEPLLEGWTIFLDQNENGVLDAGEVSTTTDEFGEYSFTGLVPGPYTVAEVMQPDWSQSYPASGSYGMTLVSGDVASDMNFGNYAFGEISGTKWDDLNINGIREDGEPGIEDWTVFLDADDDGELDWTDANDNAVWDAGEGERWTLTDADGAYVFDELSPGDYVVAEVLEAGWTQSAPTAGAYALTVTSGLVVEGNDFGNFRLGQISGHKWNDLDGDGVWDVGETGLEDWVIFIDEELGMPGGTTLLDTGFDTDPRASGWVLTDWDLDVHDTGGWTDTDQFIAPGDYMWQSPQFTAAPLSYFRIDFIARGTGDGFVAGMGFNPEAEFGRYPDADATAGELVADDWTSYELTDTWQTFTYYTRARSNAVTDAVRFMGAGTEVDDVTVTTASDAEARDWYDGVYAGIPAVTYDPGAGRFDGVEDFIGKLEAGEDVRIVFLGDSIMLDSGNSGIDVLLERMYPGSNVEIVTAVGGGTGVDKWAVDELYDWPDHDLDLDAAVIDQQPDLVLIGGISNNEAYDDFRSVIDDVRDGVQTQFGYEVDIMLMTGAFGTGSDPAGYATELASIAAEKDTAFMDMRAAWTAYMADAALAGYDSTYFYRDGVHANAYGKQVIGRIMQAQFAPDTIPDTAGNGVLDWTDLNDNGVWDAGEGERWTTTDATGAYAFTDLMPGEYVLAEVLQDGWVQTAPETGVHNVVVTSGADLTGVDFGNVEGGTIQGAKWYDINADAVWDAEEDALEGWTIRLYSDLNNNGVLEEAERDEYLEDVTDVDGAYEFTDLLPGRYFVEEQLQADWAQTFPLSGIYTVNITAGLTVADQDFGNVLTSDISGMKFEDLNGNGAFDAGEPGLEGWTIFLDQNDDGVLDAGEPSTVTAADGTYTFAEQLPGTYYVAEQLQAGWTQSYPAAGSHEIELVSGVDQGDVDFGNWTTGSISGAKWDDQNYDGVWDAEEPALPDWTIFLDEDDDGELDWTDGNDNGVWDAGEGEQWTLTDAQGDYSFSDLPPGDYAVAEVIEDGWYQSYPAGGVHELTLVSGTAVEDLDFGNGLAVSITGYKWNDVNGDGVWDVGEEGLQDWTLYLDANDNGELDAGEATAVTLADGSYAFGPLMPDTYIVREDLAADYWTQTAPVDGYYELTLAPGETAADQNFGNQSRPLANDLEVATDEDTDLNETVTGWDFEDDDLTFAIDTQPANGTVTMNPDGSFTYDPDDDFNGVDTFTFIASDDYNDSEPGTVTVTVNPVNDGPVANDMNLATDEDTPLVIDLDATDVETDPADLIYTITSPPTHGTLDETGPGQYLYTPDDDYNDAAAPDTFTYTVTDTGDPAGVGTSPALTSGEATVSITVNPVNDPPIAHPQTVEIDFEGQPIAIDLTGEDVETPAGELTYDIVTQPVFGEVTLVGSTAWYTASTVWGGGLDSFRFTVTDTGDPAGVGDNAETSVPATVTLDVAPFAYFDENQDAVYYGWGFGADDPAVISLKKEGQGWAVFGRDDPERIERILVDGTTDNSQLDIQVPNLGWQIGDINIDGSLKSLDANGSLVGDIHVTEWLGDLDFGDVFWIGGEHTVRIDGVGDEMKVEFGRMADITFDSNTPVKKFDFTDWTDRTGGDDWLRAPYVDKLSANGDGNAVAGNFQANLDVDTLDKAKIDGGVMAGQWLIPDGVGKLQVDDDFQVADFQTRYLDKFDVGGSVVDTEMRLGQMDGQSAKKMSVDEWLRDSRIFGDGEFGKVEFGGMDSSVFGAGLLDTLDGFAPGAAGYVKKFDVGGVTDPLGFSMIDSLAAAHTFNKVSLEYVQGNNAGNAGYPDLLGPGDFGVVADVAIDKLQVERTNGEKLKFKSDEMPDGQVFQDFWVRVV